MPATLHLEPRHDADVVLTKHAPEVVVTPTGTTPSPMPTRYIRASIPGGHAPPRRYASGHHQYHGKQSHFSSPFQSANSSGGTSTGTSPHHDDQMSASTSGEHLVLAIDNSDRMSSVSPYRSTGTGVPHSSSAYFNSCVSSIHDRHEAFASHAQSIYRRRIAPNASTDREHKIANVSGVGAREANSSNAHAQ